MEESLCRRCGKCCYRKVVVAGRVQITPFPCEYLDADTNLCTVYARRAEIDPECLSVPEGMRIGAFPADCGYLPRHAPPNYQPALEGWHWGKKRWRKFDELADLLEVSPEIRAWVRERGPQAPPKYVDTNQGRETKRLNPGDVRDLNPGNPSP